MYFYCTIIVTQIKEMLVCIPQFISMININRFVQVLHRLLESSVIPHPGQQFSGCYKKNLKYFSNLNAKLCLKF